MFGKTSDGVIMTPMPILEIKCPMVRRSSQSYRQLLHRFSNTDLDGDSTNSFLGQIIYTSFGNYNGDFDGDEGIIFFDNRYKSTSGGFYSLFGKVIKNKKMMVLLNNYLPNDISNMIMKKL